MFFVWFFRYFLARFLRCFKALCHLDTRIGQDRLYGKKASQAHHPHGYKNRPKPDWVKQEIIRSKAINPNLSCRLLAKVFNHRYAHAAESVSKSYVANILKCHRYEMLTLRKTMKSRPVHTIEFNKVWGMDLTFVNQQPVLGLIEHHSRRVMMLKTLTNKSSLSILRALLEVLDHHPKPRFLRTDNEVCFNSRLIRFGLWFLGIKKQTTEKHCPWQNGRIERFFGTLKHHLRQLPNSCKSEEELPYLLQNFQWWYNNVRLHQNLDYQTPESAYQNALLSINLKPDKAKKKK